MKIARLATIVLAIGAAVPAMADTAACVSAPVNLQQGVDVLEAYRAFKGPDGTSKVEKVKLPGTQGSYYGGSVKLTQFDLGDPSKVVVVFGHPNIDIPVHPAPYREIFLVIGGWSEIVMADGTAYRLNPGSMFISEDMGATGGRGGRAGPCGYIALDVQFKPVAQP